MTDQDINREIAEACGWHQMRDGAGYWNVSPDGKLHATEVGGSDGMPNYCGDLNAMRAAVLSQNCGFQEAFELALINLSDASSRYLHALTAKDWAECLRTVGKWKDA